MSIELSAEALLARAARQDVEAFSELYDRFAPRVYALMVHILPSREAAEAALQQVFVRLWNEGQSLGQEGGSVAAWLVATARDLAVERLRALRAPTVPCPASDTHEPAGAAALARKSKAAVLPAPDKSWETKSGAAIARSANAGQTSAVASLPAVWLPPPADITRLDERLPLLHKVIGQLPKPQRQALELAVFGGLSEAEIAAKMGEPLGKVQRSLRAAVTFVRHRRRAVCGAWAANI